MKTKDFFGYPYHVFAFLISGLTILILEKLTKIEILMPECQNLCYNEND